MLRGLNLAGAEFGQLIPGQPGRDYIYPGSEDFKFCAAQGFNIVRLPFKWERLQPDLYGAFDSNEWSRLEAAIAGAATFGLSLIIDPHNYARRRTRADAYSADHMIGSELVPATAFISFWQELARRTRNRQHVIFGIMNEPADLLPAEWLGIVNPTLAAIREAGAKQLILVPGTAYSGAHSWIASGNAAMSAVRDPENNFAIEVHQYLDEDSSGTSGAVVSPDIGAERLREFQSWARENKLKAFLGEFGAGQSSQGLKALENIVREVEANADIWIGWTAWAAGPWWPDDQPLRLSKSSTGNVPAQTKLLSAFAQSPP